MLVKSTSMTREMSASEERAMLHMLSGDPLLRDFIKSQSMAGEDPTQRLYKQAICPRCERGAFYHNGGVQCATCGHWSPEKMTTRIYLSNGYYK